MDENVVDEFWEDREAAKKVSGTFANRIYVQPLGDAMLRIHFGEELDQDRSYHTAIVVTAQQAAGFGQLIYNIASSTIEAERQAAALAAEEQARNTVADAEEGLGGNETI